MKLEKLIIPVLIGIAAFVLIKVLLASRHRIKEAFGYSAGTMVQLSSSHVPTEEDADELIAERRQIQHDLIDLTGSP